MNHLSWTQSMMPGDYREEMCMVLTEMGRNSLADEISSWSDGMILEEFQGTSPSDAAEEMAVAYRTDKEEATRLDELRGDVAMALRDFGYPHLADEVGAWSNEEIAEIEETVEDNTESKTIENMAQYVIDEEEDE